MFKTSRRLDYGMQIMITLATETDNQAIPTAQLANKLDMPLPFLHQIAHTLMQTGLIKASPGPHGGLRLATPSSQISALQIIEALEGPINLNPCQECSSDCVRTGTCPTFLIWNELQDSIANQLRAISLNSLTQKIIPSTAS